MAKQATPSKAPAAAGKGAVATRSGGTAVGSASAQEMAELMKGDAGKGVSTSMDDNVVPLIYVLQALSPQVQKKKEEYIKDAEAGHIWFRGGKSTVNGDEGIPVVPCYFSKAWIEWMPNRGGYVARHDSRPEDCVMKTDAENPKKKAWMRPNGNQVVETREHVVLVLDHFDRPTPFVIPMSGSGHSASRAWMGLMNRKIVPDSDLTAPSYGYVYRMKTSFKTNDQGDWYMWEIEDEGGEPMMVTDPGIYKMARKIEADFSKGTLRADAQDLDNTDTGTAGSDSASKHI